MRICALVLTSCGVAVVAAQAPRPSIAPPTLPRIGSVRPIRPPATPLAAEAASAGVTRFSIVAYGDTRCDCRVDGTDARTLLPGQPESEPEHAAVVDAILAKAKALAATPFPVRLVAQSGDATWRGPEAERWNDVFTPIVERMTLGANLPFFFVPGNHDVTGTPVGDPDHSIGLHNTLSAIARLIPPEGSPRRLNGYATYAVGYGNLFLIGFDSNIAADVTQLAWVTDQLEHLDPSRYHHIVAMFHHPAYTSGRYSGAVPPPTRAGEQAASTGTVSPQALAIRSFYMPLFRRHHVQLILTGHDHLFDHWVERYEDRGRTFRLDQIVSGGGGAPGYVYTGEPDLTEYLAAGFAQSLRVEHLARPGRAVADNPHHFLLIRVDGDRLSVEVVASRGRSFTPYDGRARVELNP